MSSLITIPCPRCERPLRVYTDTDGHGRVREVVESCGWCERKRAGICQRCHVRRVRGKVGLSLWCGPCYPAVRREQQKRLRARKQCPWKHRGICVDCKTRPVYGKIGWAETCAECRDERHRAASRRAYQTNPEARERRNAYKREWRKRNRDKVRAQKRRAALWRGGKTPDHIVRWRQEVAAGIRQPKRARRNDRGERLCLTPGCPSVMRGHAKKCEDCKRREIEPAMQERAA